MYEYHYQVSQITFIYITCYYALNYIDKHIANHFQNSSLRITLSIIGSIWIYHTFPADQRRLDYAQIQYCAFIFFSTLRLFYLVLYNDQKTRQNQTVFQFVLNWLYFVFPISKQKDKTLHLRVSLSNIIRVVITDILPSFLFCFVACMCNIYFITYLTRCLDEKSKVNMIVNSYWYFTYYCLISVFQILSAFASMFYPFQSLVRCVSLNRYKYTDFNNYPLFSVSIKEIWSKRYNYFVRSILHDNIFKPLMDSGYSAQFAAFMAFFMSGLLHVYISWKHMGKGLISTQWFFVLHGIITICETYIYGKRKRDELSMIEFVLRICITNVIFALTLPYYVGLYLTEYPEMGDMALEAFGDMIKYEWVQGVMTQVPQLQCIYPY